MSHRDSLIKKNKELNKPLDIFNVGFVGNIVAVDTDPPVASGGTETTYTAGGVNYKAHTFTSSGTLTVTTGGVIDVLLVGGGGAGTTHSRGGAGGGVVMVTSNTSLSISSDNVTVTVGAGGAGACGSGVGANGNITSFGSYAEVLGGIGNDNTSTGANCPSDALPTGVSGNIYQNKTGGVHSGINKGGGAGCNQDGVDATSSSGGHGGNGIQVSDFNGSYYYGGGGGGGTVNGYYGTAIGGNGGDGGGGGGGAGHYAHGSGGGGYTVGSGDTDGRNNGGNGGYLSGGNGGENTGGGGAGGGSGACSHGSVPSNGGKGIVVVRYIVV